MPLVSAYRMNVKSNQSREWYRIMTERKDIFWLPDSDYSRALFHLRGTIQEAFRPFQVDDNPPIRYRYGLEPECLQSIEEVIRRAEDFSLVVRGLDKQLDAPLKRR